MLRRVESGRGAADTTIMHGGRFCDNAARVEYGEIERQIVKHFTRAKVSEMVATTGHGIPALVTRLKTAQVARDDASTKLETLPEPSTETWSPDWLMLDDDGVEDGFSLDGMLKADVDMARSFLSAFLRGERIVVTPGRSVTVGAKTAQHVDYHATGDAGALVGQLVSWRRARGRKSNSPHQPSPSPG